MLKKIIGTYLQISPKTTIKSSYSLYKKTTIPAGIYEFVYLPTMLYDLCYKKTRIPFHLHNHVNLLYFQVTRFSTIKSIYTISHSVRWIGEWCHGSREWVVWHVTLKTCDSALQECVIVILAINSMNCGSNHRYLKFKHAERTPVLCCKFGEFYDRNILRM